MRLLENLLASVALTGMLASAAFAAEVTGTVQGPDGKPFMGAFVVAQNTRTKVTVNVLSDASGHYRIVGLPGAAYSIQISAVGYRSEPRNDVTLAPDQKVAFDFALQTRPVRWNELSTWQGRQLLPKTAAHDLSHNDSFFVSCFQSCHSFQKRMTTVVRDEDGWRERVRYMSDAMMAGDGRRLKDGEIDDIATYLTVAFGPDSPKPASPSELPQYKSLIPVFKPEAMNIVYVEYDFPAQNGMGPWSAVEDRDGMIWIPYYGRGNEVVRLNPDTAEMTHFKLPFAKVAGIHSVYPAPDGKVWFVETALGKIARLDPATGEITEFQSPPLPDGKRAGAHTIRVDAAGIVWVSGGPTISRFDPATSQFTHFNLSGTYGNVSGQNGDQWFTAFREKGPIGRVSKDGVLTTFDPPTNGKPQRLEVAADGMVWFTERRGNKIGRLDPQTGKFTEFPLPGPEASPYAIGFDRAGMLWYPSHEQDTMNRFDPKTAAVTEYPTPHSEMAIREFFCDSKGRIWYGASTNNKIGYFYLSDAQAGATK